MPPRSATRGVLAFDGPTDAALSNFEVLAAAAPFIAA